MNGTARAGNDRSLHSLAIFSFLAAFVALLAFDPQSVAQTVLLKPAYKFAAASKVGVAEAGTATLTFSTAGAVSAISVLAQGIPNQDFKLAAGGSCAIGLSYLAGQTCTTALSFQPNHPGVRQGAVVLLASNGSVLASELLIGTGQGATELFIPGMISTVAGNGQWIFRGDGGPATQSPLFLPMGGAADAVGNLFLSDSNNQRIRRVDVGTGNISTVAGNGTPGFAGDGGPATVASLDTPADVKLDGAGNFYIADSANHAIRMVNAATGIITTVAGVGGQVGYSGDGGQATQARLAYPSGIAFDGDHLLYISDTGNNAIRRVDLSTGIITTYAGTGTTGYGGDGGPATAALLNYPWGITLDADGSLYIADLSNNRIRKVTVAGVISTAAGAGDRGYGGDGGLATAATLNVPAGVVVDVAGNLYLADSGNHFVRKVSAVTGVIQTIAGLQSTVQSGDGGPATGAALDGPYALFLDGPGNLYIADMFHQTIRMVSANTGALSYPVMRVGGVSNPQPETVENDGNATLDFSAFTLISNSALDAASTTCTLTQPIQVNQTCVLGVEFMPTTIGLKVTGSISVASDAANTPGVVNLFGQVLLVQPTQISLTANKNPAAIGTAVTFTVSVSNSSSTPPTGGVTFLDGSNQIGIGTLNNSGAATLSTATLAVGTHQITAVYAGDTNNAPATSQVLAENIEQPTTTTLTSSPNPSVAGIAVTFTATVNVPLGITTVPTGTVSFSDGAVPLGTSTLNATGVATLAVTKLNSGQHNITATYNGDSLYLSSQSLALVQTVTPAATNTTLTTSNATVFAGVDVTFTAAVSRTDSVVPAGPVSFLDGASTIGTATLNATGLAVLTINTLPAGTHTITAVYGGDTNNLKSTSTSLTETVQPVASRTTVAASINPSIAGAILTLSATVVQSATVGSGGPFSGTITFQNGTTIVGTAPVSAAGVATLNVATLAVGPNSITAKYGGNTNYLGSTSAPLLETIVAATTSTVLISNGTPSIAGKPVTFTAVVSGTGGVPTGTVTFNDGTKALGTATLNATGVAAFTTSSLAVGLHTVTAVYSGDANDTSSTSAPLPQAIQIATSTTAIASSLNPSGVGAAITFTAAVTTNGGAITGTVTFSDGTTALGAGTVNAGSAVFTTSALAIGNHSITASYAGDANNTGSLSASLSQQVEQAGPITLTSSANPAIATTNLTFTATVAAPQNVAVTGTVTFKDGATVVGTATVAGGVATFSTSTLAVGQHSIVASYSGDANNLPATSNTLVQTVQIAGTIVTIASGANPALAGASLTFTSTVAGTGGTITGTVTFQDGTKTIGAANVNSAGVAAFSISNLSPGPHSIIAVYGGDPNNSPSTSPVLIQNVVQSTTVALTSSQSPSLALDSVTFTAKVLNGGTTPPTGSVIFSDSTSVLGTVALDATGTATIAIPAMRTGQHPISAAYGGDTLDLAATSTVLTQSVQLRITSNALTASSTSLTGGQQVTLISVVRYNGPIAPTGTVTFTNSGSLLGTVVVDNTGVATFTVNLLTSAPTVIARYSGDSVYAPSASAATSIVVAKPTLFSMQLSPAAITLQSRQNSMATLTITSVNSFTDTLSLGCLGLPHAATCTFTKDQVALAAGGTQAVQVVIDTGSPLTAGSQAKLQHSLKSLPELCFLPGSALLGLLLWRQRKRRHRLAGLWMLLLLAGLATGLSGCAGLQISGTPPGTYVFQMSATGTGTGTTQVIDVTLTVTQ